MKTVCLEPGCDEPRMVSKAGKTLQRCEYHQREKWRQTARERGGYKARGSKVRDVKAAVKAVEEKALTPRPPSGDMRPHSGIVPPLPQGEGEKKAVGHPWRQYPKPAAAKMAKVCPVCGRTPAMAGLWARMGVICVSCRMTVAGVIA